MKREIAKELASLSDEALKYLNKEQYIKNREVMLAYADGKTIECLDPLRKEWKETDYIGFMLNNVNYRIKNSAVIINGHEVNKGLTALGSANLYFVSDITTSILYSTKYRGEINGRMLTRGIVHNNEHDAIAMAKAMLGIDPN